MSNTEVVVETEENQEMANKFYVPNISEFYEGFEYQEEIPSLHINFNTGEQTPSDFVWRTFMFNRTSHFIYNTKEDEFTCSLEQDIKDRTIRVKYLDKEDIESLGYMCTGDSTNGELEFQKHQSETLWFEIDLCLFESLPEVTISDWYESANGMSTERTLFKGYVKNKSELKTLLKQLRIYG